MRMGAIGAATARWPLVRAVYMYLNALTLRGQSLNDEAFH